MGVPRVTPSRPTPLRISHESSSFRGVVMRDCPGLRRSSSIWSSSREIWSLGGTPSTTQPTPPPWDSPNVVTRNRRPNELPFARVVLFTARPEGRREEGETRGGIAAPPYDLRAAPSTDGARTALGGMATA